MHYHIRTRIAVAISLLTLSLLAIATWLGLAFFERQVKKVTFSNLSSSLDMASRGLEWRLLQAQLLLENIGEDLPRDIVGAPQSLQKYLKDHISASLVFDNVLVFFDRHGVVLMTEPYSPDVIGKDFSYREYFKITAQSKHRYISRPFPTAQEHNHPIIMFTEPILDKQGQLLGVLGGTVDLYHDNFLGRLVDYPIGEKGYFILLDNTDNIIMHPDPEKILNSWKTIIPQDLAFDLWTQSRGHLNDIVIEGQEMIGTFRHISIGDWTLLALLPTEEVFAPIQQLRIFAIVAMIALSVLGALFIRRITYRFTEPLIDLSAHIRKYVEDKETFEYLPEKEFDELGELAGSIRDLLKDFVTRRRVLQDQLTFLENLMETIPSPTFYKDAAFRYVGCNRAFLDYIGLSRKQLIGRSTFDIFEEGQAEIYNRADLDLWNSGGTQIYETKIRYADGTDRDVIFHKKVFEDAGGVRAGIICTFFDISERKEWEKALVESEERFRLLVENAADAFFLFDVSGKLIDVNRHACLDLGYSREELLTKHIDEISHDYRKIDFDRAFSHMKRIHQTTIEDHFIRKDGSTFPTEVRLCHVERDVDLYIALARDITERKQNEHVLREALASARSARDQVDNILKSVADGVLVVDERRRVKIMNSVAEELLNVRADEIHGKPFTCLLHTHDIRSQFNSALSQLSNETGAFDIRLPGDEGKFPCVVHVLFSRLKQEDGTFAGIVALLHDVTREREVDRVKSEFISTAAHELRTPLSVILGYCELLLESDVETFSSDQRNQFLIEIFKKGQSVTRIVDDLFDISRIEAGLPLPLDISECHIDSILNEVAERFSSASPEHRVESKLQCKLAVPCDESKLVQVFENLISNAVKYSPGGGVIHIETECQDKWSIVRIRDEGIGMTREQLDKVFDKFYRADSSNTSIGGLGIGMSIVKAIVETHGGKVTVASEVGSGTLVTIELPMQETTAKSI